MAKSQEKQLEKEIESKCAKLAKSLGILTFKFVSPSQRGVPDRIFILQGGETIYVEFKRLGEKPTKLQQAYLDKLRQQGAFAYCCDSVQNFREVLDRHRIWIDGK